MKERVTVALPYAALGVCAALVGPAVVASVIGGGFATVAVSQVVCFALPAALAAWASGALPAARLGLHAPAAAVWPFAGLVAASYWLVNLTVVAPVSLSLFGESEALTDLSTMLGSQALWVQLAVFAALPAVCEELLMRGAVARSLDTRLPRAGAVLASAAVFALLHWPLARMLPSFTTGAVLALLTFWSRSIFPAMAVHFFNNAFALLLAHPRSSAVADAFEHNSIAISVLAITVFCGGMWGLHSLSTKNR